MEELSFKLEMNYTSARLMFLYKRAFVADGKVHLKRFIHYHLSQDDWMKKKSFLLPPSKKTFPNDKRKICIKNERKSKLMSMLKI